MSYCVGAQGWLGLPLADTPGELPWGCQVLMAKDQLPSAAASADANALDIPPGFDRDRMLEVLKIKEQANEKFRAGDYFSAKCLYSGSLEMLERCCLHLDKADEVWEGIKNNMALCDLKRQEWARAVDTTTEILQRNNKNTKALYRRGVARIGQSKLKEAREDLEARKAFKKFRWRTHQVWCTIVDYYCGCFSQQLRVLRLWGDTPLHL